MTQPQHVLQCVWPITDDTYTVRELIDQATGDLEDLAARAHAIIVGPPVWSTADAADVPGWTGYAPGMVLLAAVPAVPVPQRPRGRRSA